MSRVQSIERAFAVLGALADGPIGVTEVADRVDLPKSTAARLLASLAREGVVEQVPGDTRYRLGPRLVTLAARIRPARTLAGIARPSLEELAGETGEAAGLSVRDGEMAHYIDQVGSPNPVSVRDWTGSRIPLHAVSSGQVLLAHAAPTFVQRYLGRPMESFTARTLTSADALLERMRAIRRDGYTWALEEFDEGISSVAAPVADAIGRGRGGGSSPRAVVPVPGARATRDRWPSWSSGPRRESRRACARRVRSRSVARKVLDRRRGVDERAAGVPLLELERHARRRAGESERVDGAAVVPDVQAVEAARGDVDRFLRPSRRGGRHRGVTLETPTRSNAGVRPLSGGTVERLGPDLLVGTLGVARHEPGHPDVRVVAVLDHERAHGPARWAADSGSRRR